MENKFKNIIENNQFNTNFKRLRNFLVASLAVFSLNKAEGQALKKDLMISPEQQISIINEIRTIDSLVLELTDRFGNKQSLTELVNEKEKSLAGQYGEDYVNKYVSATDPRFVVYRYGTNIEGPVEFKDENFPADYPIKQYRYYGSHGNDIYIGDKKCEIVCSYAYESSTDSTKQNIVNVIDYSGDIPLTEKCNDTLNFAKFGYTESESTDVSLNNKMSVHNYTYEDLIENLNNVNALIKLEISKKSK